MAAARAKDIAKLSEKDRNEKLQELRMELIRGTVTANKAKAKTKEIKRAIARIHTFNKPLTKELRKK